MSTICLSPTETLVVLGIYFGTFALFILLLKLMARTMDQKVNAMLGRFQRPHTPRPNVRVGVDKLLRSGVLREKERTPDDD